MPQALAGSISLFFMLYFTVFILSIAFRLCVTRLTETSSFSLCKQFFQGNPDSGGIGLGLNYLYSQWNQTGSFRAVKFLITALLQAYSS